MAAPVGPWVKRTKYCMTPESSTPTAQRDFEYTENVPGCRLSYTLPDTR